MKNLALFCRRMHIRNSSGEIGFIVESTVQPCVFIDNERHDLQRKKQTYLLGISFGQRKRWDWKIAIRPGYREVLQCNCSETRREYYRNALRKSAPASRGIVTTLEIFQT
jgi:hypothetical protein